MHNWTELCSVLPHHLAGLAFNLDPPKNSSFYFLNVKDIDSLVLIVSLIFLSTGIPTFTNPAADVTGPAECFRTHETAGAASRYHLD